ncbi:MAG: hypothetical protein Q4C30_07525, partial [Bacteroidia bacterium]|nr:hypothetical protein [Bacteroidia bacterium]
FGRFTRSTMHLQAPSFTYTIVEPGLANASLTMGDDMFAEFSLPNVCNPLGDLLTGLMNMIVCPKHLWGEQNVEHVIWYGENEQYNWEIEMLEENRISVKVCQIDDFFGEEGVELLSFTCKFDELVLPIIRSLDEFIKRMGLLNYHQQWQKDEFPLTVFLFLKKYLIENGKWARKEPQGKDILNDEILILLA